MLLVIHERTVYRYIDQSLFSAQNIDLRCKVAQKKNNITKHLGKAKSNRNGRMDNDYISFLADNPSSFAYQICRRFSVPS